MKDGTVIQTDETSNKNVYVKDILQLCSTDWTNSVVKHYDDSFKYQQTTFTLLFVFFFVENETCHYYHPFEVDLKWNRQSSLRIK